MNMKKIVAALVMGEALVLVGIVMGYFHHSLLEIIFPVLGNLLALVCFVLLILYKKNR